MAALFLFLRFFHSHLLGGCANSRAYQQCRRFAYYAGIGWFIQCYCVGISSFCLICSGVFFIMNGVVNSIKGFFHIYQEDHEF